MSIGITKDRLNLRTKPGTDQLVLQVIPAGTQVTVLATSGDWLQVQTSDGSTGYVSAAYVDVQGGASAATPATPAAAPASAPTPAATPAPISTITSTPVPVTVVVSNKLLTFSGDILHVRSAPAIVTNPDNKIETLQPGAQMQPLEDDASLSKKIGTTSDQGLWIHVQTPSDKQGYVAAWLVQYVSTAAPTPQPAAQPAQSQAASQPTPQPAAQPAAPTTSSSAQVTVEPTSVPDGNMIQPDLHDYIDKFTESYTLPQGYYDFWKNRDKLGLPDPFDISPTKLDSQHLAAMPVNGFGPNSFSEVNWQAYYKNVCGMHNGLDHIVPVGTQLVALTDGIILGTEKVWPFMGNAADQDLILWCFLPKSVRDSQGHRMLSNVMVAYAHMSNNAVVKRHDIVQAGQVIGISGEPAGETGNAHLHMELHLLSGDSHLPRSSTRRLNPDFKRDQPFDNHTPFNPLLFFSERVVAYHLHQGKKIGFSGGPTYPSDDRLAKLNLHWPTLDFFTLACFQYGSTSIWNCASTPWPSGIYDLPTEISRIASFPAFEPYPVDFLQDGTPGLITDKP